jgi:peptidoglycan/LPS O-acetylase OafA/YrhL
VPAPSQPVSEQRRWILDYIRLILALVVVAFHYGYPTAIPGTKLHFVLANLANGPAAVVVFFVISGFCIHAAHIGQVKLPLLSYFTKREIRVTGPALVAIAIAIAVGGYSVEWKVLWSLVCEEAYYVLYPAMLLIRAKSGWKWIWVASAILFVFARLTAHNDIESNFNSPGLLTTWMLGLPCWILGAVIAEFVAYDGLSRLPKISISGIWFVRTAVFALSCGFNMLRNHMGLSNMDVLPVFGFISGAWLIAEMKFTDGTARKIPAFIAASFSVYLCHQFSDLLLGKALGHAPSLWMRYAFALAFAFVFFLVVERPFHKLARSTSKRIRA